MQFLLFVISYPIIWFLSRLPMSMLYLLSDILYFLIYTVFGYRKQVVLENLKLVFPEKTAIERNKIAKHFFTHFTDLFVVRESREKFGCIGYKTSEMVKGMQKRFDDNEQGAYLLLSDQSPQIHKTFYWSEFFGVKVPIHTGAEMLSKKFDLVVINYITKKIKRGYYETEFQLITDTPKEFKDYEITDKYIALTEKNILEQPQLYLWSHKRFKHRDKVPSEFL